MSPHYHFSSAKDVNWITVMLPHPAGKRPHSGWAPLREGNKWGDRAIRTCREYQLLENPWLQLQGRPRDLTMACRERASSTTLASYVPPPPSSIEIAYLVVAKNMGKSAGILIPADH